MASWVGSEGFVFFFKEEAGMRVVAVTGVQTFALPISDVVAALSTAAESCGIGGGQCGHDVCLHEWAAQGAGIGDRAARDEMLEVGRCPMCKREVRRWFLGCELSPARKGGKQCRDAQREPEAHGARNLGAASEDGNRLRSGERGVRFRAHVSAPRADRGGALYALRLTHPPGRLGTPPLRFG